MNWYEITLDIYSKCGHNVAKEKISKHPSSSICNSQCLESRQIAPSVAVLSTNLLVTPDFHERAAIFDHTVRGTLSRPGPHLKGAGLRNSGPCPSARFECRHATPRTWRSLRQTYSGRSARVATRPEGQASPPHVFNLPRLSPPRHRFSWQAVTPV
jgi:hypothetical protein